MTVFLFDLSFDPVGTLAGYTPTNLEVDGADSRFYSIDVGTLAPGRYLIATTDPVGSGYVDTTAGSGPWLATGELVAGLNLRFVGGEPVRIGDLRVNLAREAGRICSSKLTIYWGEDHVTATGASLRVDGITHQLNEATGKLTIAEEVDGETLGTVVVDHLTATTVDIDGGFMLFDLDATAAQAFDLSKNYFFFCQAWFTGGKKITVKKGYVDLLESAEWVTQ